MILDMRGVSKSYGEKWGLSDCNLSLKAGDVVGLLGPNGSGKTTLLKLVSGLLVPSQGELNIQGERPRKRRDLVAYSSDGEDLYPWMKKSDVEKFMSGLFADFDQTKFQTLCETLSVPNNSFSQMSKGEKRRLKLSLTMARRARLYLLDEPLAGIDILTREQLLKGMIQGWDRESALVLSTHEFEGAETFFNRVVLLKQGRVAHDVAVAELHGAGKSIVQFYKEVFQ